MDRRCCRSLAHPLRRKFGSSTCRSQLAGLFIFFLNCTIRQTMWLALVGVGESGGGGRGERERGVYLFGRVEGGPSIHAWMEQLFILLDFPCHVVADVTLTCDCHSDTCASPYSVWNYSVRMMRHLPYHSSLSSKPTS